MLKFGCELVMDGRKLPRPVNYALVRIVPPDGIEIDADASGRSSVVDPARRPRAGHRRLQGRQRDRRRAASAGHPCYFIGFLPEPVPGQTIEDIARAEAAFLERVIALHPDADGKPAVVGNCQAGWAVMLLAAVQAGAVRADHRSPARPCPIGPACTARTRCATRAGCWAAAG